jgi:hypothetical protein
MYILATHETDGEVVIVDTYYDTENTNLRLVYIKADGTIEDAAKNKFTVQDDVTSETFVEAVKNIKIKSR